MPAVNAGTSGAKPKYCRRKVQYAVRTSPRHVATCDNDANGAKHAVEATTRQLSFFTPARGVHSVQGKESWETHVS
jgi:hypothetical protein